MSGFGGFGSSSTGSGLFGTKPPDQPVAGFTIPTTITATTATGSFGTSTFGTGTGGLFGGQQQASGFGSGFNIKPTTAGATSTGFTFGLSTPNPVLPTFGTSNTGTPTFGVPSTSVVPTLATSTGSAVPTFGVSASNTTVPTFGSFGTSNTLTFGTPGLNTTTIKSSATTGLTFSSASSTPAVTPSFNFGVSSTTPGTLPFGISTTSTANINSTTSVTPAISFGIQSPATAATTTTSTFTTTTSSGFTFTQPSTTSTLTFGTPKTTGGFTFGTTTTAGTTTKSLTFNLGTSTTTTPTPTLATGLFGSQKTDSVTITTATTSIGLGGVDKAQTTQGLSGSGTLEPKQAKDHSLPDPILHTLNEFQNFTKQQKSISVEISHGSSKPLKKVQEDTEAIESLLMTITSGLTKNAIAVDKLKTETAQGLHQAEMAQRNRETPPGLEYDNSAPSDYFNDLVTKFETDTVRLRVQIEASEKHLKSLTQCSTISPQELTLAMRRLHETLIVLAARVQALHTTVQSQKEQFKNLRRVYFKDDTNIFESESEQSRNKKKTVYSLRSLTGPTPFSETPGMGLTLNVDGLAMLASSASAATPVAAAVTPSIPNTTPNPSWRLPLQEFSSHSRFNSPNVFRNLPRFGGNSVSISGNKRSKR